MEHGFGHYPQTFCLEKEGDAKGHPNCFPRARGAGAEKARCQHGGFQTPLSPSAAGAHSRAPSPGFLHSPAVPALAPTSLRVNGKQDRALEAPTELQIDAAQQPVVLKPPPTDAAEAAQHPARTEPGANGNACPSRHLRCREAAREGSAARPGPLPPPQVRARARLAGAAGQQCPTWSRTSSLPRPPPHLGDDEGLAVLSSALQREAPGRAAGQQHLHQPVALGRPLLHHQHHGLHQHGAGQPLPPAPQPHVFHGAPAPPVGAGAVPLPAAARPAATRPAAPAGPAPSAVRELSPPPPPPSARGIVSRRYRSPAAGGRLQLVATWDGGRRFRRLAPRREGETRCASREAALPSLSKGTTPGRGGGRGAAPGRPPDKDGGEWSASQPRAQAKRRAGGALLLQLGKGQLEAAELSALAVLGGGREAEGRGRFPPPCWGRAGRWSRAMWRAGQRGGGRKGQPRAVLAHCPAPPLLAP